jgi:hypothetical protein
VSLYASSSKTCMSLSDLHALLANVKFTHQASKPNTSPPAHLIIFCSAIISKTIPETNLIVVTNILESSPYPTCKDLDAFLSAGKLFYQMCRVDSSPYMRMEAIPWRHQIHTLHHRGAHCSKTPINLFPTLCIQPSPRRFPTHRLGLAVV